MAKEACALHPDCAILKAVNGDVDKITAKTVFDLAKEGDDIANRVFRRYVKYLTIAINNVVSFLDPDMIVLGGGVSRAGDFLLDAVRELLPKYLMYLCAHARNRPGSAGQRRGHHRRGAAGPVNVFLLRAISI